MDHSATIFQFKCLFFLKNLFVVHFLNAFVLVNFTLVKVFFLLLFF